MTSIEILKGKTLTSITVSPEKDEICFVDTDGKKYKMYHWQQCCESVVIDDIVGDLQDLIGSPLLISEETSKSEPMENYSFHSFTWTFYKLATVKGSVDIKWYGTSNGYYSERVDFVVEET